MLRLIFNCPVIRVVVIPKYSIVEIVLFELSIL
jgi:hypothetical protein